MTSPTDEDIEIRVEFERGTGDPTRVFRAMTGLIEAAQDLDSHLALGIGASVRTSLVLQDVEAASLKAILRTVVSSLPDEAVKAGEVKKVIGHYLISAKHKILDWCGERDEIQSREEVKQLQDEVHALAEASDIKVIPAYAPIELTTLLSDITAIKDALSNLAANDNASFTSADGQSIYNRRLHVSEAIVQELVTRETIPTEGERIIKVKKPDYLGTSKWEFKYAGHAVEAKILDAAWLHRFQSNLEPLSPGDSLRVILREVVAYGYDSEIVSIDYTVLKVLDILPGLRAVQTTLN
jgi:hypothetical protein